MPTPIAGQQGFVLTGDGAWAAPSWLEAIATSSQTAHLTTGDHVLFGSVVSSSGSDVALDLTSTYATAVGAASVGRFTVAAGKSYRLFGSPGQVSNPGNSPTPVTFAWWDATADVQIGAAQYLSFESVTSGAQYTLAPVVQAFFRPSTASLVELRLTSNAISTALGSAGEAAPYASIEVVR